MVFGGWRVRMRRGGRASVWIFAVMAFAWAGCGSRQPPVATLPSPIPSSGTAYGVASWYGPGFNGHRTSSGITYNENDLTAASVLFPLGAQVRVTNLANGRMIDVTINDHGPYLHGRAIDLSHRAAIALGMIGTGTAHVRMDVLTAPAGGPPIGMRYFVQVGSFGNPANARRMRERVAMYYPDARIIEADSGDAHSYRVRMGAFMDHEEAAARASRLTSLGYPAEIITE
jgi:rare lipoprotein A